MVTDSSNANLAVDWDLGTTASSSYSQTIASTSLYVGNVGATFNDIQTVSISDSSSGVSAESRVADDLDGNGQAGYIRILADLDGDGLIGSNEVVGLVSNFSDLHTFNVSFDHLTLEDERHFTSLEFAKQHVFFAAGGENLPTTGWRFEAYHDDWHASLGDEVRGLWRATPDAFESISWDPLRKVIQETRFSLFGTAGLRGIHHDNDFYFLGTGSILGRTEVEQTIDHYAFGPQLGFGVVAEASMFRFEAVALGLVGYGRVENEQRGIFGEEAIPGALNRSATARTSRLAIESDEEHVAWHGETRVTGSCQLTQRLRFDATWRWFVTGPAYDALGSVAWNAPDFGFQQTASGRFYSSDCFLGLTYTH